MINDVFVGVDSVFPQEPRWSYRVSPVIDSDSSVGVPQGRGGVGLERDSPNLVVNLGCEHDVSQWIVEELQAVLECLGGACVFCDNRVALEATPTGASAHRHEARDLVVAGHILDLDPQHLAHQQANDLPEDGLGVPTHQLAGDAERRAQGTLFQVELQRPPGARRHDLVVGQALWAVLEGTQWQRLAFDSGGCESDSKRKQRAPCGHGGCPGYSRRHLAPTGAARGGSAEDDRTNKN
mmetsp:Transcript_135297/g.432021  ORF Transcript_135297/g.432021 Transcript_135297/m.432021 type:complete len:238 (+) Transcript_135297:36-749(+)